MNTKVNLITLLLVILIVAGSLWEIIPTFWIIPVAVIYLSVNIAGSYFICINYYFKSFCHGSSSKKAVALTFDDGPDTKNTSQLLDILQKYNVKASFFVTGKNCMENPDLLKNIFFQGHVIGNHSYTHSGTFDLFSSSKMKKEIELTNEEIKKITGKNPKFFRPPYGVTNPMLKKAFKAVNMYSIGWSLRSLDTVLGEDKLIKKLKDNTRPGDIILFHDTTKNIAKTLETYINWLLENNYKIVDLPSFLNIDAYEN